MSEQTSHELGPWSELRQEHMSPFEVKLYRQHAGLEPEEAVVWWEQYIFSAEAAQAIEAGWSPADAVAQRRAESEARAAERELARRRQREREEEFAHGAGVLLTAVSRSGRTFRIRQIDDGHFLLERGTAEENLDDIQQTGSAVGTVNLLATYLLGTDTIASIVSGSPDEHLRLSMLQPLARVTEPPLLLDGRPLVFATARSLKTMLIPMRPEDWPSYREVDESTWIVDDVRVTTDVDGDPMPFGLEGEPDASVSGTGGSEG